MRSTDRILTTHVGSLVRPPELVVFLRNKIEGKPVDEAAFNECLEKSVKDIVKAQTDIGIDIISDGEFGKTISWSRYVLERMDGFVQKSLSLGKGVPAGIVGKERRDFAEFYAEYDPAQNFVGMSGWAVVSPIKYKGHREVQRDIADLKRAVSGANVVAAFMPAVAPSSVAPDRKDEVYPSDKEYLYAVAEALREEYKAIIEAGFLLQVDDAYLASTFDIIVPPGGMEDYRRWAQLRVDVLNHALQGLPADRIRYHVCWGSWNGPHVTDVPLRSIIDLIFQVNAGGYSLEMANPRHEHEWRVFEDIKLPESKVLLPGFISHATNVVEHPELVCERIVRLANLVGRERVIASTDCGFAQGPFTRRVHPSIMWAKLRALVEGAELATKLLWKR
jgi:5-methyltetrahydropteroyltriglutamate--homocysteine methyltransferase